MAQNFSLITSVPFPSLYRQLLIEYRCKSIFSRLAKSISLYFHLVIQFKRFPLHISPSMYYLPIFFPLQSPLAANHMAVGIPGPTGIERKHVGGRDGHSLRYAIFSPATSLDGQSSCGWNDTAAGDALRGGHIK